MGILRYLGLCGVLVFLMSCDSAQKAWEGTQDKLDQISPLKDETQKLAKEELNKLFSLEYKVVEVSSKLTADNLQIMLSELGQQRWDCFNVIHREEGIWIFCKRKPETYLRYIPRVF